jgi:hypothetical protein
MMEGDDEFMSAVWASRMDLMEADDHYQIHVDLPGGASVATRLTGGAASGARGGG